jgi:uncharacterized protein YqiB (DUF1249 family)
MLVEKPVIPGSVAKPRSFIGLMSLYEENFNRINRLIPELARLDGCYRSRVPGDCDLYLEILERSRYTVTFSLTYFFPGETSRIADPDLKVRAYLDGQLAEAMSLCGVHRHKELRRLAKMHRSEISVRWHRNIILNKWLEYLLDTGHLILEK